VFTNIIVIISVLINIIILFLVLSNRDNSSYLEKSIERIERSIKEEISSNRAELALKDKLYREENSTNLNRLGNGISSRMTEIATMQKNQLDTFAKQLGAMTEINERKMDKLTLVLEEKMKTLQEDNSKKLDQMRMVVDEKLHAALEQRLGESFKLVSDRLELVHKGLGEMQSLANGVGDLKKVLTNVKIRGSWGEIQLGSLLQEILVIEQYDTNVITRKDTKERVEFAIKIPSKEKFGDFIYLPIDSKFPMEDYQRLIKAQEDGDKPLVLESLKQLEQRILSEAKDIKEKYLEPPYTTDFGIMFLPIESLYCEVLRIPGLSEKLQTQYKVVLTGPTTLAALLNSLQMGFRSLAIEKRSSEVWEVLSSVKTEFIRFGDILEKTQKKLQEASNTMEKAAQKSRTIERKLKNVQSFNDSVEELEPLDILEDTQDE